MRSRAEGIADSLWSLQTANNNDDVAKYTRSMVEDSISFKVYFLPKDSTLLGGGGMIRLSKRDLSVIGGERYQ